jgi:hypothetical protein
MRQTLLIIPAAAVALATAALAQPAHADTKTYSLSNFDEVSASAGVTVILKQGPFNVKADESKGDFDKLVLEVRGDKLVVSRKSNSGWFGHGPNYTVTVTAPTYSKITASSGSDVDGRDLQLKDLKVEVSSGADMELAGACNALSVDISSGADFDGEELKCQTASVDASSGSDADAWASASAKGQASSGADITFHGKPATFDKETSSGGSVKSL